jgi:hypothetical protein
VSPTILSEMASLRVLAFAAVPGETLREAKRNGIMATAAEISAAVSSIYEAAVEFERWPRTLLQISDLLGGTMAALVRGDRATGAVSTLAVRSYAGAREEYATHYHAHNIAWQKMAHVPPGRSVVDRELFPREAVRQNACYGEFLKRLDVHSLLTAIMEKLLGGRDFWSLGTRRRVGFGPLQNCASPCAPLAARRRHRPAARRHRAKLRERGA